jgi:hypothetical protein
MGYIAYDVNQVREYVSEQDKGESKTTFKLGVLDSRLYFFLQDGSRSFGVNSAAGPDGSATVNLNLEMRNYKAVKYGLKGWENLRDRDGVEQAIRFRTDTIPGVGVRQAVADESLDLIKPLIPELAREILRDNSLTAEEERRF